MKTTYMILVVSLISLSNAYSQGSTTFKFQEKMDMLDVSRVDPMDAREHILGDEIAKKMVLLTGAYTKVEPATPTSPVEKTIIHKPIIYNSIKKLNKYYVKGVKKDELDIALSSEQFVYCLDVAISIAFQNTTDFESELKNLKDPEGIYNLFAAVVLE